MAVNFDYAHNLVFNPEGKVKQLEYIKKTTELGNISIALANKSYGVMISHTPKRTLLAERQQKVFEINPKTLFTFSGITNDGLTIVKYLKNMDTYEGVIKDRQLHPLTCFERLGFDAALKTLTGNNRIYGVVGVLMTDFDNVRLVEFEPSGYFREVKGTCIGSNSQACRTILEEFHTQIDNASKEDLISLGISALRNAFLDPDQTPLKTEDVTIYVLESGKGIAQFECNFE